MNESKTLQIAFDGESGPWAGKSVGVFGSAVCTDDFLIPNA